MSALAAAPAHAAATLLGTFGDWYAWTDTEPGNKKFCYMHTTPLDMAPKGVNRGDVYLQVIHRSADNSRNVVSIVAGYSFAPNAIVTATVDTTDFKLFTKDDGAWNETAAQDAAMVKAMVAGSKMSIKGTSVRNTVTTDTYSLSGFTAAHDAIDKACPAGR